MKIGCKMLQLFYKPQNIVGIVTMLRKETDSRRHPVRVIYLIQPAEQFLLRDLRNADLIPAGLEDDHADGLDVIQSLKEIQSAERIHPHLAVAIGIDK